MRSDDIRVQSPNSLPMTYAVVLHRTASCNITNDPHNCSDAEFVTARRINGHAT